MSVADNIKRDIAGEKKHPVEFTEENRPDYVIEDFREILNILP